MLRVLSLDALSQPDRPAMTTPPKSSRKARDRALSIALALMLGLILGVGGWLVINREALFARVSASGAKTITVTQDSAVAPSLSGRSAPEKPKEKASKVATLQIVPQKALYGIRLVSAKSGSQIINISGKMYYQIQHGCEAWITDHRFVLDYEYADSEPMRVVSDFSTAESQDGQHFDFTSRRRRNGELYQDLRGKATKDGQGQGAAVFTQPAGLSFDLTSGDIFPTEHTIRLIKAAQAGKKFLSISVFDGTDEEGPVEITALIGDKNSGLGKVKVPDAVDSSMLSGAAWPVRLAFFPKNSGEEVADYELTMILHENGVISDMTIDYKDFSVRQSLLALERISPETCSSADMVSPKSP